MKILVCVKPGVPADQSLVIDESRQWIISYSDNNLPQLGRYDEIAVEQALTLKDAMNGVVVDVLTVGAPETSAILRRALGVGTDNAILVINRLKGYVHASVTARFIVNAICARRYDLILSGALSEDLAQGLVGPMIAEALNIPCVTSCKSLTIDKDRSVLLAKRDIEGARLQTTELKLPALATIQACPNKLRYPSLSNIIRANNSEIEIVEPDSEPENRSDVHLVSLKYPVMSRSVQFLNGSSGEKALTLASLLRKRALLA
ncbi:MAG: hypothetical protein AB7V04_10855 [Desulfomonilaceae bacterium]